MIAPADKLAGRGPEILAARDQKLTEARQRRAERRREKSRGAPGSDRHRGLNVNRKNPGYAEPGHMDGHNDNLSWNRGLEGGTDDPEVLSLRARQARNFLAVFLLISIRNKTAEHTGI